MVGFAQVLAAVAIVGVLVWLFAGVALRLGGWVAMTSGLIVAVAGGETAQAWSGVGIAAAGALLWLAGQAHFATRHGFHASPLARRLFRIRPLRFVDPTVRWHGVRRTADPADAVVTAPVDLSGFVSGWPSAPRRRRR
jgi:hypothetical protein